MDAQPDFPAASPPQDLRRRAPLPVDAPPRPLTRKAAMLQARRRVKPTAQRLRLAHEPGPQAGLSIASANGTTEFRLRRTGTQLFVQQIQRRPLSTLSVLTMAFADRTAFERWCDGEPTRFDQPVLFERLKRQGHALLDALC